MVELQGTSRSYNAVLVERSGVTISFIKVTIIIVVVAYM